VKDNRQPVKTVTVVIGDDGSLGILGQHRSKRRLKDAEIARVLSAALDGVIAKIEREDSETPVDKARKHIVQPPPGLRIRKKGEQ
jgi:hypothetical protein